MSTSFESHPKFERLLETDPAKVAAIMAAPAKALSTETRSVRNALRNAKRNGTSIFVGHNYSGWFAGSDPTRGGEAVRWEATPDGAVFEVQMVLAVAS